MRTLDGVQVELGLDVMTPECNHARVVEFGLIWIEVNLGENITQWYRCHELISRKYYYPSNS